MKRVHESVDYITHPHSKQHLVNSLTSQLVQQMDEHTPTQPPVPLFVNATDDTNPASLTSSPATSPTHRLLPVTSDVALKLLQRHAQDNTIRPDTVVAGYAIVKDQVQPKYTVYVILVEYCGLKWVIYRRYNDFRTLYDAVGRSLPSLPAKGMFRSFASDFLAKRAEDLNDWLQKTVCSMPLVQLNCVQEFLSYNVNIAPPHTRQPTFTARGDIDTYLMNGGVDLNRLSVGASSETDRNRGCSKNSTDSQSGAMSDSSMMDHASHVGVGAMSMPAPITVENVIGVGQHPSDMASTSSASPPTSSLSPPASLDRNVSNGSQAIAIAVPNGRNSGKMKKTISLRQRILQRREGTENDPGNASSSTTTARNVNKVGLDNFDLIRVLGKGSFGKVVLARKRDTQKLYAMKILDKDYVVKKKQVEHTKTERSVLSYMNHPFIVKLHFAFQTGDKLHFVLDYCCGGELFFHLGRAGRFTENLGRFYAAEIALALGHIHAAGVVYRDLKPENILLDKDGHIKLADFGLSKEGISSGTEGTHSFCGTPEYLAPEVLKRLGHGTSVDWWSLGALLYEMLTGLPPWYSQNKKVLFKGITSAELKFPAFVSPVAQDILSQFLRRDSSTRLGSNNDVEEIKTHPFFASVDWDALYRREVVPPFVPTIEGSVDTRNFETVFTRLPVNSMAQPSQDAAMNQLNSGLEQLNVDQFDGFTFTDPTIANALAGSMGGRRNSHLALSLRRRSMAGSLSPVSVLYAKTPGSASAASFGMSPNVGSALLNSVPVQGSTPVSGKMATSANFQTPLHMFNSHPSGSPTPTLPTMGEQQ